MNRREFLQSAGIVGAGLSLTGCSLFDKMDFSAKKPNIIFILADDLGYGSLGCYGQKDVKTPFVDRMASEGIRFTQCYAGSMNCAPSRSVLMTGLHTGHTPIRANAAKISPTESKRIPLKPEDITVAELLKQAGYVTGITGKWGLGEPETTGVPNKQGFDEWFGYLNQGRADNYYPEYLWRNEEKVYFNQNKDGKQGAYSHDLFTDWSLDFIKRHKEEPFFLYIPYCLPHANWEIPSVEPYDNENWSDLEKIYAAMITRMDKDVGRIIECLKELDIDGDTIVFFSSDNGPALRHKPLAPNKFNNAGPLRDGKWTMYEGGIRVPMVVRWPGKVPAGKVDETVWYFADFLPTACDLAGFHYTEDIDGVSVLPTLLDKKQVFSDRFLYWESFSGEWMQAVRWKNFKAILRKYDDRPDPPMVLYDLQNDIGETTDVAKQYPEIAERIEDYLKTARTESEYWPIDISKW